MRVLVCGGRDFTDADMLYRELDRIHATTPISCIIEGGARGADFLASCWSAKNNIPEHAKFPTDWETYGRAAGPIRNAQMLRGGQPDLVVAFPGGRGTANMVAQARAAGIRVITISDNSRER